MAARRLIIVLLVLFAVSIAAAAVAPERRSPLGSEEEATTESTTPAPEPTADPGGIVTATIQASVADPQTVRATVGDQVELAVSSRGTLQAELADLGLLEVATPEAPARFDLIVREPGELSVTDAGNGAVVGRLLVVKAEGRAENNTITVEGDGKRSRS